MRYTIHLFNFSKFDHKRNETIVYRLTNHVYATLRLNIRDVVNLTH